MKVRFFDGSIESFIVSLEKHTIARVLRTIDLLETFGNQLGHPHSKKIERGIYELRIRGRQEIRILYTLRGGEAILLSGFVKKSERIPKREIETARQRIRIIDRT